MSRRRLAVRLAKLELTTAPKLAAVQARARAAEDGDARLQAAWQVMQATMSEEHVRLVLEADADGLSDLKSPGFNSPTGRLLRRCLEAINRHEYAYWPYTEIAHEVALAMPPVLAEVYLAHDVLPLHDCEVCGFSLPHGFFDACPLCGGRIGWYAYWRAVTQAFPGAPYALLP